MSEKVHIHGLEHIPDPYKKWVKQRNGTVGEIIAGIENSSVTVGTGTILPKEKPDGIFYGTIVQDHGHVDKSVLHPAAMADDPFRNQIQQEGLVLPGISVTTPQELLQAYTVLRERAHVRAKQVNGSDGNGQYNLSSEKRAQKLAEELAEIIHNDGIVLESRIHNPKTISVGTATIGKEVYSFIAHQKDETVKEYDEWVRQKIKRHRYMGAEVTVARGEMGSLLVLDNLTVHERHAVEKSARFHTLFTAAYGIDTTRISYDYMYGESKRGLLQKGDVQGGITDITARPGGTDPALVLAIRELYNNPSLPTVSSEVTLDYTGKKRTLPPDATIFVTDPALRIHARVTYRSQTRIAKEVAAV